MNGIFSFFSQLQWNPISFADVSLAQQKTQASFALALRNAAQSKRRKKLLVHVHNKIHQSNSNSFLGAQEYHTTIWQANQFNRQKSVRQFQENTTQRAFALGSLWVRSGSTLTSLPEAKKRTRQCGSRDKAQTRELWHICLLDNPKSVIRVYGRLAFVMEHKEMLICYKPKSVIRTESTQKSFCFVLFMP